MTVHESKIHSQLKMKAAISSVIAALFLTGLKLIFAIWTGSLGILSEFAHSGLDLIAALVTVFSVKISDKPADKEHQYGYGKVENLSAIAQVLFLLITCGYIIYEAAQRLFFNKPFELEITAWAFVVMFISIAVDISRSRYLKSVAIKTRSQALEADAMHFSTDIWSSSVVIIGLLFAILGISKAADAVAALMVSVFVIYVSYSLVKRAVNQLMDKVPEGIDEEIRNRVITIEGVEKIKSLRVRESGSNTFFDMIISISRTLPFQKAHDIMDKVEDEIKSIRPHSDVVIHSEPIESVSESVIDKVRLIVNSNALKCHDIYSYEIGGKNFVELDVEYSANDNFEDAHSLITKVENEILAQIQSINRINIHIDEPGEVIFQSENVTEEYKNLIDHIYHIIKSYPEVHNCKDFSIIKAEGKLRISLTCLFPKDFIFSKVHMFVHKIEREIYSISDDISSVMIHAEPE
jgi:cation diffusion facilitator family transporter